MISRGDTDVHRIDTFILNVFTNEGLRKQFVRQEQQAEFPELYRCRSESERRGGNL